MYSGHYPRIFVAPKNAQNTETKRGLGAVPILLLVIPAMMSPYSSLYILQGFNPQPQLLKALVYHSATSAVVLFPSSTFLKSKNQWQRFWTIDKAFVNRVVISRLYIFVIRDSVVIETKVPQ